MTLHRLAVLTLLVVAVILALLHISTFPPA